MRRGRSGFSASVGGSSDPVGSAASVAKTAIAGYTVYSLLKGNDRNRDSDRYDGGPSGRSVLGFMMKMIIAIISVCGCCLLFLIIVTYISTRNKK